LDAEGAMRKACREVRERAARGDRRQQSIRQVSFDVTSVIEKLAVARTRNT
jgi:hypothetical protein